MKCSILLGQEEIGTATITVEGLYYHFLCSCRLSGDVMYQIIAQGSTGETSLGICVPMNKEFGIRTKVPIKKIGSGKICLFAVPKHKEIKGEFVPIRAEEPFAYIEKLEHAYYSVEGGTHAIWIPAGEEIR